MSCARCSNEVSAELTSTEYIERKSKQKALTDYSLNVLFVLGFLSVGDGGSEAQRLLGLCGLPNYAVNGEKHLYTHSTDTSPSSNGHS